METMMNRRDDNAMTGMLTLTLPKAARSQPRSIKINSRRDAAPVAAQSSDIPTRNEPASVVPDDAATGPVSPDTEYVPKDHDTAGTVGNAATASSAGVPSGGPSDADADATPSLS
jgi:hypothetical protein